MKNLPMISGLSAPAAAMAEVAIPSANAAPKPAIAMAIPAPSAIIPRACELDVTFVCPASVVPAYAPLIHVPARRITKAVNSKIFGLTFKQLTHVEFW